MTPGKPSPIVTSEAPAPVGPYSQAVRAGELLFLSGQIALDPSTGAPISGGVEAQTERVMKNLEAVLRAGGSGFADVVKVTIFVKDMGDFAKVNEVYARCLGEHRPARACVEVSRLPKDALVEMDLVAYQPLER